MATGLGTRIVVVGANRGLGLSLTKHLASKDVQVLGTSRTPSDTLESLCEKVREVSGVDIASDDGPKRLSDAVRSAGWERVDALIVVAGLLTTDTLEDLKLDAHRKMYEVCALGPLRLVSHLVKEGLLSDGSKVALITSEGGSIGLRSHKEGGSNYGHHLSKAAENMAGKLLALDLKPRGIAVVCLHPGFMKSEMTEHYSDAYDKLGAIETEEAAPKIAEAVARLTLENTGRFVAPFGAESLGFGVYALAEPEKVGPFGELPW